MKHFLRNNHSDKLLLFFTGWGCDEYQFGHLKYDGDVLFLYNYNNLELDFDFSKYKEIIVMAYSAGVFISSVFPKRIPNVVKRIMIDGNPYLFDEKFGVPKNILTAFMEVDAKNCIDFRKKYLVSTHYEMMLFSQNEPHRDFDDCFRELLSLQKLYKTLKDKINPRYDKVIFGEKDPIFKPKIQKEFYKTDLKIVPDAKHNIFFRFKTFEEIIGI